MNEKFFSSAEKGFSNDGFGQIFSGCCMISPALYVVYSVYRFGQWADAAQSACWRAAVY